MHAVINRIRLKEPQIGNEWMRAHVVSHAAGPPDRVLGEVVPVFERD